MEKNREKIRKLILCAFFAALTAVGAFIKIPVPVVPFTLQFLCTTLAGWLLGGKWGALSVAPVSYTHLDGQTNGRIDEFSCVRHKKFSFCSFKMSV